MSGKISSGFDTPSPFPRHLDTPLGPRQVPNVYGPPYGHPYAPPNGEMKQLNEEEEPSAKLKVFNTHKTQTNQLPQGYDNIGVTLEDEDSYVTAM